MPPVIATIGTAQASTPTIAAAATPSAVRRSSRRHTRSSSHTSRGTTSHVTCDRRPVATPHASAAIAARAPGCAPARRTQQQPLTRECAGEAGHVAQAGATPSPRTSGVAATSVVMRSGSEQCASPASDSSQQCAQDAVQQEQGACAGRAGQDGHREGIARREVRRERRHGPRARSRASAMKTG